MSRTSLLISPVTKHASSAAATALVVYLRPARMPKMLRRALLAANTAGSVTPMLVGSSAAGATESARPAPLAERAGANADSIGDISTALASLAGSVTLLTSKPALRLDRGVERMLLRRGVRRPRLLMAAGAAGAVVVVGVVTDRLAKAAEQKVAELQRQEEQERIAPGVKINPPPRSD